MEDNYTPIEIPEMVASWSATEDDGRPAMLDVLFDGVDAEALGALTQDVIAEIMLLNGERTPENVTRMETLDEYLQVLTAEGTRREAAVQQLDTAATDILARARERATAAGIDPAAFGDPDPEPDPADPDAGGEGGEGGTGDGGDPAPAGEPVGAGAASLAVTPPAPPAPPARRPSGSGLAAAMQQRYDSRGQHATTVTVDTLDNPDAAAQAARMAAEAMLNLHDQPAGFVALNEARTRWFNDQDLQVGEPISFDQLAQVIWAKKNELRGTRGSFKNDWLPIARASFDYSVKVAEGTGLDAARIHNLGVFTSVDQAVRTIVASGGSCAPAMPRYEVNQYAMAQSPVEDNLPVVGAPRGTVEWVRALDFTDLRSGIGVTTNEEDANPEGYGSGSGETPFKPCVHVDCPTPERRTVVAVSSCIEFGNLTYETWPEFVAARLKDLAANFASVKEVFYLDRIDEDSDTSTEACVYGAYRGMMHHVDKEAWNYRKRHNMNIDAQLDWYAPDWLIPALRQDIIEDFSNGTLDALPASEITRRFSALGLNVIWYYDSATGENQAFSDALAGSLDEDDADFDEADPANQFPTTAVWYLEAPGTHVRFDAGELNMGIVRDSILNKTNNMQLFEEQFIEVGMFGAQTVKGVTTGICVSGAAPQGATLHTC